MRRRPAPLSGYESTMAESGNPGVAGSRRGVSGASVRGHESVRDTCETGDNHAEGYTISEENQGGLGRVRVVTVRLRPGVQTGHLGLQRGKEYFDSEYGVQDDLSRIHVRGYLIGSRVWANALDMKDKCVLGQ